MLSHRFIMYVQILFNSNQSKRSAFLPGLRKPRSVCIQLPNLKLSIENSNYSSTYIRRTVHKLLVQNSMIHDQLLFLSNPWSIERSAFLPSSRSSSHLSIRHNAGRWRRRLTWVSVDLFAPSSVVCWSEENGRRRWRLWREKRPTAVNRLSPPLMDVRRTFKSRTRREI